VTYLPPRPPLLPSEGITWPPRLKAVVTRINTDKRNVSNEEWQYFKKHLREVDPEADIRWKSESARRRAITYAVNYLNIEDLEKLIKHKHTRP
jgi:hypothetical protein